MTAEEAIKTIEIAIAEVEWEYPLDYSIAFETALNALEKQMPKKPINEEHYYICPRCRDDLGVSDDDILSMNFRCLNIAVIADVCSTGRRKRMKCEDCLYEKSVLCVKSVTTSKRK